MSITLGSGPLGRRAASRVSLSLVFLVGSILAAYAVVVQEHVIPRSDLFIALRFINIVSFLLAGVLAWWMHPDSRTGLLLVLAGFAFLFLQLQTFPSTQARYVGAWLGGLPHVLLAHLILTYPTGRFSSRVDRMVIGAAYVLVVGIGFLFNHSRYGLWLLWVGVCMSFIVVLMALRIWLRAEGARKRVLRPVPFAAAVLFGGGLSNAVAAYSLSFSAVTFVDYGSLINLLTAITPFVPLAFLFGFQRTTRLRGALGNLVVQLENVPEPGHLRDAVARALRDPTLELAYWVAQRSAYLDAKGNEVALPEGNPERLSTTIEHEGEKLAIIIHDVALREERALVDAVMAAAKLALVNERLQAEVRAQLEEVRQSRSRIVEAGDKERRKIERDLHDGAQQRLVSLNLALKLLEKRALDEAGEGLAVEITGISRELKGAIQDLRELAQGLHPTILTERGLAPALEALAERAPFPVALSVENRRFPAPVEATAYFVVAEALTNISKHAPDPRSEIIARVESDQLLVVISDDGLGGADARRGSGLTGLEDRVAAIGGTMVVESPVGQGTTIKVRLPCE